MNCSKNDQGKFQMNGSLWLHLCISPIFLVVYNAKFTVFLNTHSWAVLNGTSRSNWNKYTSRFSNRSALKIKNFGQKDITISAGNEWNKNCINLHLTPLSILEYTRDKIFVVHGRQTAEPMYFLLDAPNTKYNISFAVDGTEVLWNRHHYFLFFNSARAVNSMGKFLVILCALVAPSFY